MSYSNFKFVHINMKHLLYKETCSEAILDDLKECVCRVYRKPSYTSVNKLRYYSLILHKYQDTQDQVPSVLMASV